MSGWLDQIEFLPTQLPTYVELGLLSLTKACFIVFGLATISGAAEEKLDSS